MSSETLMFAGFAVMLAAVAVVNVQGYFRDRDGDWHIYNSDFMRRRIAGKWECRAMTEDEQLDFIDRAAW